MLEESTVRIKVYLPPYLNHSRVDEHGYVEIEKGASGAVHLCRVNYDKADLRQQLQDGDIVSFYSLISGG